VALDEILEDITLSHAAGANKGDNIAFAQPGVNDICVVFSC
jgi:hypothetical protein